MAPKEKAEELVHKYNNNDHLYYSITIEQAKTCALIAVDEIVKSGIYSFEDNRYWEEVKKEIEKRNRKNITMAQQKLYTEEQVSEIFKHSQMLSDCNEHRYSTIEYLLADNNITPIELPSDEEIREEGLLNFPNSEYVDRSNDRLAYYVGAKWMKEQILNQSK